MKKHIRIHWIGILIMYGLFSCEYEKSPAPLNCEISALDLEIVSVGDALCGESTGSISLNGLGGQQPYQFRLGSQEFQSEGTFENLSPGSYHMTVKDDRGCERTTTVDVLAIGSTLAFLEVDAEDSGCKTSEGVVNVVAQGDGVIEYKIGAGDFQTSNTFSNVAAGTYDLVIKDDSGCESVTEVQVFTGISFENDINPILMANCAISGCHNGNNGADRNWTIFSNVQAKAAAIKTRTGNGSMPQAGSGKTLTQHQIDMIACWVDDGALAN